jgi:hypothetical protein
MRRSFCDGVQEFVRVSKQPGLDLRAVAVHHRLHIGDPEGHAIIGKNA